MKSGRRRERNPHGEGGRLRQELIEAAGRVLAASPNGGDLSLRAVAREAGVAAPSVYLLFADKADLVQAVRQHYFELLRRTVVEAIEKREAPEDRLRVGCLAYCRFGLEHPGAYRVLFQYEPADPRYIEQFGTADDAGARAFATLVDCIRDCIDAGIARPADPFEQAIQVWAAMHGYVSLVRVLASFPWQPVEDHIEDLLVNLVGVPRQRQTRSVRPQPPLSNEEHAADTPARIDEPREDDH